MSVWRQCLLVVACCLAVDAIGSAALAQYSPSGGPAPPGAVGDLGSTAAPVPDPVAAQVGDVLIHRSEVADEMRTLPGHAGVAGFEQLYSMALRRLIERAALVERARANGLADNPDVLRHMLEASDRVLEEADLRQATAKLVTEAALLQRYDAEVRGKPGPEEVHGWAILVPSEAEAQGIIAKLAGGADFAGLAQQSSKDASAIRGGDMGFVRRSGLLPEVAAVLFALRPGEVTPYPVHTPAGWFVLRVEARRNAPTPSFAEAHDRLQAELQREAVPKVVAAALQRAAVKAFDSSGSPVPPPADDQ